MSAWIVGSDQLDLILTSAIAWQLISRKQADETGRMLWRENLASVAYRYPDDRDGERPGPDDFRDHHVDSYRYRRYPGRVDPQVVAAAAQSLAYQSCEHPAWKTSTACPWVSRLEAEATARIDAYIAEHGPVDVRRQRKHGWSIHVDLNGNREIVCGDGWQVPNRNVFRRAAALRTPPTPADGQATTGT